MKKEFPKNLKVKHGRMIYDLLEIKPKEVSGIYLPDSVATRVENASFDEHPYQAIVMAVDETKVTDIKPGDLVYLNRLHPGNSEKVIVNGEIFYVCFPNDVICVIQKEEE